MLPIADGLPAKTRLEDNLKTARERLLESVCWFCGVNPPDEQASITRDMYGEVVRTPTPTGTRINWRYQTISVPRCTTCAAWHKLPKRQDEIAKCVLFCLAPLPLLLLGFYWFGAILAIGASIFAFAVASSARDARIRYGLPPEDLRPFQDFVKYPAIKELMTKGWQFGKEPAS